MTPRFEYRREENTIFATDFDFPIDAEGRTFKVAVINKAGYLQPAKGMADHREAVEAFLAADRIPEDPINPDAPLDVINHFTDRSFAAEFAAKFGGVVVDGLDVRTRFETEEEKQAFKVASAAWLDIRTNQDPDAIPPCPPEDPRAGDKTPEVIAWWHTYHPAEASKRYANRKFTRPD